MGAKILKINNYIEQPKNIYNFPYVKIAKDIRKAREKKFKKECQDRLQQKLTAKEIKLIWLCIT
tara:strand:+ start:569 stop:760 length:192 start_codon:yes stop_codon:yes gene_type:complete